MAIGSAIEAIKIIEPYVGSMRKETEAGKMLKALLKAIQDRNPPDSLRLVSLMHGMKLEDIMESFGDPKGAGPLLLEALIRGFNANPLPDLVNAGALLGLIKEGWTEDAGRTN
jgi:hypothetical protein